MAATSRQDDPPDDNDDGESSAITLGGSMHLHHHNHTTHAGRSDTAKHTGGWLLAILLVAQLMVILDVDHVLNTSAEPMAA